RAHRAAGGRRRHPHRRGAGSVRQPGRADPEPEEPEQVLTMDAADIRRLLEEVKAGALTPAEAAERLRLLPYEAVGASARVDHHRELRSGIPEVVLGEFKTAEQIAEIVL